VTCHRGRAIPRELVDIVTETGNTKGASAAVAQYRELRNTYFGAEAYDFTDATLFVAAQRALAANKPDDAIAYTQLNTEFNPKSGRSYQLMSQAYVMKKDTTAAIGAMEKATAAQPNNEAFKTQLERLKKPGA
jgi:predicted Zn-dependent protease